MTRARKTQVCLDETPYYHCISRCVRRAWLCGEDPLSGQNFDHRKQWLVDRIKHLASVFSIDICAYAVMSNHYHLVLRVDRQRCNAWSNREVAERWRQIYKGSEFVDRWLAGDKLSSGEKELVSHLLNIWRERLHDLSWFMRCLNEYIAQQANREDNCTGRFWEGRYKSQALLDETALLTCMTYVDLNPIRAGISQTPEASDFTSINERILSYKAKQKQSATLVPFNESTQSQKQALPLRLDHYIELVDWTGRAIRNDKTGHIPSHLCHILDRISVEPDNWLEEMQKVETHYFRAIGAAEKLTQFCRRIKQRWVRGSRQSARLYKCAPA